MSVPRRLTVFAALTARSRKQYILTPEQAEKFIKAPGTRGATLAETSGPRYQDIYYYNQRPYMSSQPRAAVHKLLGGEPESLISEVSRSNRQIFKDLTPEEFIKLRGLKTTREAKPAEINGPDYQHLFYRPGSKPTPFTVGGAYSLEQVLRLLGRK